MQGKYTILPCHGYVNIQVPSGRKLFPQLGAFQLGTLGYGWDLTQGGLRPRPRWITGVLHPGAPKDGETLRVMIRVDFSYFLVFTSIRPDDFCFFSEIGTVMVR